MSVHEFNILWWMFQNNKIGLETFLKLSKPWLSFSEELLSIMEESKVQKGNKAILWEKQPYWYLRDGDLYPESVNEYYGGRGVHHDMLKELEKLGNLFNSKEEAAQASQKVREFIRSLKDKPL